MKIADVVVLASDFSETADGDASARFDRLLKSIKSAGLNPIVVMSAASGDALLLASAEMEDCDLAFDPNYEGELFSSIKAGLCAAEGAAIVLRWSVDSDWLTIVPRLMDAAGRNWTCDVIVGLNDLWAVTLEGAKRLKTFPANAEWSTGGKIQFTPIDETFAPADAS